MFPGEGSYHHRRHMTYKGHTERVSEWERESFIRNYGAQRRRTKLCWPSAALLTIKSACNTYWTLEWILLCALLTIKSACNIQVIIKYEIIIIILMTGGEGLGPVDHQISYRDKHRRKSTNSQKYSLECFCIVNVPGHWHFRVSAQCVCVCVCVCVSVYICMYIRMHVCMLYVCMYIITRALTLESFCPGSDSII